MSSMCSSVTCWLRAASVSRYFVDRELNVVDLRQPSEEPLSTTVMQLSVNLARKSCMYVYREFVQPGHV